MLTHRRNASRFDRWTSARPLEVRADRAGELKTGPRARKNQDDEASTTSQFVVRSSHSSHQLSRMRCKTNLAISLIQTISLSEKPANKLEPGFLNREFDPGYRGVKFLSYYAICVVTQAASALHGGQWTITLIWAAAEKKPVG
jgi:hypothetical protein